MKPERAKTSDKALLDLIPFGLIDATVPSVVAAHIQVVIGIFTRIQPDRPRPEHAFIATRRQFDASKILKSLFAENDGAPFKLGLIQEDLCLPILTYVYGESQLGGRAAVISMHRLFDTKPEKVYERAAKISIHEVGHMIGLEHCRQIDCLMRFSKQLEQLDQLPMQFCSACEYEISRRFQRLKKNGIAPISD